MLSCALAFILRLSRPNVFVLGPKLPLVAIINSRFRHSAPFLAVSPTTIIGLFILYHIELANLFRLRDARLQTVRALKTVVVPSSTVPSGFLRSFFCSTLPSRVHAVWFR